ncbi:MAG: precorrin-6y C5,15-methyltransferase (decarboxylating) subunit CbiE [Alphaproteobacteria bacterium]
MTNNNKWLMILGVRSGYTIPQIAEDFLKKSDAILTSKKNLSLIKNHLPKNIKIQNILRPFNKNIDWLKKQKSQGKKIIFIASGDPNFFGTSKIILQQFTKNKISIIPAVSIISLVAGKMGWAIEDCHHLSVHGSPVNRPVNQILHHLYHRAKIIIIGYDKKQIHQIADLLNNNDFGKSLITIFNQLGEDDEKILQLKSQTIHPRKNLPYNFYTLAIEVLAQNPNASSQKTLMPTAGHDNMMFAHDGQITKAETRAVILAKLKPAREKILWDIGAGSGSVIIEWGLLGGQGIAIEEKKSRHQLIKQNIAHFGLEKKIITYHGSAENIMVKKNLPPPDAIFVGGGVSNEKLMTQLWQLLSDDKILLSASHSIEGFMAQLLWQKKCGGDITTITIEQKTPMKGSKKFHTMAMKQKTTLHLLCKTS